jgi:hypothetical protein
MPFVGVVRASRRGLRWRRSWSLREQRVGWDRVRSCTVGTDHRLGVSRHTHRLVLEHDEGQLEVTLRGPRGALALVGLRDRICAAAHLKKK